MHMPPRFLPVLLLLASSPLSFGWQLLQDETQADAANSRIYTSENNTFAVWVLNGGLNAPSFSQELVTSFAEAVMRAMDTLEKTFDNKAARQIHIKCHLTSPTGQASASSISYVGKLQTKTEWNPGDLGTNAIAEGFGACVNDIENLWKYGASVRFDEMGSYYSPDADLIFYNPGAFYTGVDASGIRQGQLDAESIALHEMGHVLGFYASNVDGQKTALEMLTVQDKRADGTVRNYFTGEQSMALSGSPGVDMGNGYTIDGHIMNPDGNLMNDGTRNNGAMRQYSAQELAMFKDMGWQVAEPESIPEPSVPCLAASVLAALLFRRRR